MKSWLCCYARISRFVWMHEVNVIGVNAINGIKQIIEWKLEIWKQKQKTRTYVINPYSYQFNYIIVNIWNSIQKYTLLCWNEQKTQNRYNVNNVTAISI